VLFKSIQPVTPTIDLHVTLHLSGFMMLTVQLFVFGLLSTISKSNAYAGTQVLYSNDPTRNLHVENTAPSIQSDLTFQERNLDDYPRQFALWTPSEIRNKVLEWKSVYPNLVRVATAQDAYGLPRSGGANDCPFDEGGDGCLNYIVTIQDFVAHPDGSHSSNELPEIFWSGCVHGKFDLTVVGSKS
jgi:hypothetical protein